jgi:hyperosmotically inducible protein
MALGAAACAARLNPAATEDAQLAMRVKTAIVNDAVVGVRPIEVRSEGGIVRLTGSVASQDEARQAVEIARSVAGVREVRSELAVATPRQLEAEGEGRRTPDDSQLVRPGAFEDERRLLALGVSIGWSEPRRDTLEPSFRLGPLVRFGRGSGWGASVGFSWFGTDIAEGAAARGHLRIRPVMVGPGYTLVRGRTQTSFAVVAGPAFNGYSVDARGPVDGVVVDVAHSFAWRPGVSVWHDLSRRLAVNVFAGHVVTRPEATVLEGGQFFTRSLKADTSIVQIGLAYKIF